MRICYGKTCRVQAITCKTSNRGCRLLKTCTAHLLQTKHCSWISDNHRTRDHRRAGILLVGRRRRSEIPATFTSKDKSEVDSLARLYLKVTTTKGYLKVLNYKTCKIWLPIKTKFKALHVKVDLHLHPAYLSTNGLVIWSALVDQMKIMSCKLRHDHWRSVDISW